MKKVLIVGQTNELGRTEELYARGFSEYGCQTQVVTWKDNLPNLSDSALGKVTWRLGWKFFANLANQKVINLANQFQPDLTIVIAPLLLKPNTIKALQQHGLVFVFFTDNPLDQHHTHTNSWVKGSLSLWDAAFIWSKELVENLIKDCLKKVFYHPFCCDTQYHFPIKQAHPSYDIAFIGNWDDSRKREKYLKAIADYHLGIWGSDYWNTRCREPTLKGLCQGMCSYQDIPQVLGSAKIGLNILRPQNEMGHNIRTFEIPASGTLMLSERSPELLNLFAEDREAVYFSSSEELKQKVEYLVQNEKLIKVIAQSGYAKSVRHQISDRISEIIKVYQNLKNCQLIDVKQKIVNLK